MTKGISEYTTKAEGINLKNPCVKRHAFLLADAPSFLERLDVADLVVDALMAMTDTSLVSRQMASSSCARLMSLSLRTGR